MPKDKVIKIAFTISLAVHCLCLRIPAFNLNLRIPREDKELAVQIEIESPALLPKIEVMGKEKKMKGTVKEPELPKPEPEIQPEEVIVEKPKAEPSKKLVEVINPQKEAMLRYQDMVKQRIEEARRYPSQARRQKIEGEVYLKFTILSNGITQKIIILRSSGFKILDKEAVVTIKRAEPFPSVPKKINAFCVHMEVNIVFNLMEQKDER